MEYNKKIWHITNTNTGIWNKMPSELFIIGDIHGDFFALKQALIKTGCVKFSEIITNNIVHQYGDGIILDDGCDYYNDNEIKWNEEKKDCVIVFAGDLIDRCRNNINNLCSLVVHDEDCDYKILKLLLNLNNQAMKHNSRLVIVLGNHEIMNLQGKLQYVSRKAMDNENRLSSIYDLIKMNSNNLFGIVRIGNYVICHGGINPQFIEENKSYFDNREFIEQYNSYVRKFLLNHDSIRNILLNNEITHKKSLFHSKIKRLNNLIAHKKSPFWDRTNGLNNLALNEIECDKIFGKKNILNIKNNEYLKLVVAHCPQIINTPNMGINVANCDTYGNKIWRVDVSMSRAFDSYVSEEMMNYLLSELKQNIIFNIKFDINFILQFNVQKNPITNSVQLLYINNNSEKILMGEPSLKYFYNDVFKNNILLMSLYMLQDIESNYNYLHENIINPTSTTTNIINLINELKVILKNKIFGSGQTNYYIPKQK